MKDFSITFFGVGGSSATSCPQRQNYGSNTSCALVRAGKNFIILDMGSGLVQLANDMAAYGMQSADILLSHFHYDHIEGLQYFRPLYNGGHFTLHAEPRPDSAQPQAMLDTQALLFEYMKSPFSPINPKAFGKGLAYCQFNQNAGFTLGEDIQIATMHTNHPDFATAFKITYAGKTLVHLLDHEHFSSQSPQAQAFLTFCQDADLAVYDAYFTQAEYDSGQYLGWGHSTYEQGVALAKQANIKTMVLAHHAVWRTDQELDQIAQRMSKRLPTAILAKERMVLEI